MTTDLLDIQTIFFVDDSDDELFISRLSFLQDDIEVELKHFFDLEDYFQHMDLCSIAQLRRSITILDLNLTTSRGTEGITRIRAQPHFASHIVGICSGSDDPADRQAALEAGGNFFVSKPLNLAALESIASAVPCITVQSRDSKRYLARSHDEAEAVGI